MNKPQDYETAQTMGSSKKLPPGGYICYVKKAEERQTKDGKPMLVAVLDVFDGEYKDYFMNKYKTKEQYAAPGEKVKYPNDGIAYLPVYKQDGTTSRKFKTFCEAIAESGCELQWNDNFASSMVNKLVGVIFRREEQDYNGTVWWACKPYSFCSVEKIQNGDFSVPDDLPLSAQNTQSGSSGGGMPGFSALSDNDIPF